MVKSFVVPEQTEEVTTPDRYPVQDPDAETAVDGPVSSSVSPRQEGPRVQVRGKFLWAGNAKVYLRGVTYGPFRPDESGSEYHTPEVVERDFACMAESGFNAVRTYTVPPRWLLDIAHRHGLWVMIGLPWEQHIAFLDDRRRVRSIEARVRAGVRACAGHPAVLCYTIGNEIPASIVRWHGRLRVERFLEHLYRAAKAEDPGALVTYVNYPTTEYLRLGFLDFICFNVYLESQERLQAYLARLQNLSGDRPLVMAEIGLDSRRNGEEAQAQTLDWQLRTTFGAGCVGAFLFAWTDEWHRGGYDIKDWDFGLTRRDRSPKPALEAVGTAFAEVPFPSGLPWPAVSVVVCTYNGSGTIRDCLEGLQELDYPDYEVIVVDDGSQDGIADITAGYDVRLIRTENGGLSRARNLGMEAARGEIVAYTDDDARPDPHWLRYLAATFLTTDHVGVGGPNIAPSGDGLTADCVANAPGGPVHVLLSDLEAEHIPGCNSAFRRECLQAIGGFDPRFRAAGDDVDVCWRLQEQGWTLGFSPAAMVWHHRRNSVGAYWRQQQGYGKAEALLEDKWPEKYNAVGHLRWVGRLYGKGLTQPLGWLRERIYQGTWGSAPFQRIYQSNPGLLQSLPLMPEWYLFIVFLLGLSILSLAWKPLALAVPLLALAVGASLVQAGLSAAQASFATRPGSRWERLQLWGITAFLHLAQPLARLIGRLRYGLTPWRRRAGPALAFPRPRVLQVWSEEWHAQVDWLESLEQALKAQNVVVLRGGDFTHWDLEVRGGFFGGLRFLMGVEEHGGGRQLTRVRCWPHFAPRGLVSALLLAALAALAVVEGAWLAAALLSMGALLIALHAFGDCAAAMAACLRAWGRFAGDGPGSA